MERSVGYQYNGTSSKSVPRKTKEKCLFFLTRVEKTRAPYT